VHCFYFLLIKTKDQYGWSNLEEYHGTGTPWNVSHYGASWDGLFTDMMSKPVDKVIVRTRQRGGGRGGWSKNNPYLQDVSVVCLVFVFFCFLWEHVGCFIKSLCVTRKINDHFL
jgi:hypothetical protein